MKEIIEGLDKAFDNRVRLGIMAALVATDWVDFTTLKELLDLSDGNLATHLKALEQAQYIAIRKAFIGRKPNTSYQATVLGRKAFEEHLLLLEKMIKTMSITYASLYKKEYEATQALMLKYSIEFQKKINSKKLMRSGKKPRFKASFF